MKKILIVDDDMTFQKTMSAKLASVSYEVISAYDGEEGLAKALNEKPDLILLDIKMPKLNGLSMLKELQASKEAPHNTPVLITSNLSSMEKVSEGVELGIRGYIVKSDESLDTIVKTVESVVGPA